MSEKRSRSSDSSSTDEDLDEQLLNLSKKAKKVPSSSDDDSNSSSDESDGDEWTATNNKPKDDTKQSSDIVKKSVEVISSSSSSEEEGEINDEKKTLLSSPDDSPFDDGLDDDMMGDENDRQNMRRMTEKEREQELYNRMEKREALKTRKEIQNKLLADRKKEQDGIEKKSFKKMESFSETISARKESRRKSVDDRKKSAINEIKEKRLKKKEKELLTTKDVYSDEEDEEDTKQNSTNSSSSSEDENEIEDCDKSLEYLSELEQIRLSRHKLEQWVHLPFFNKVVSGCFVRMGIGNHNNHSVYRVVEIVSVTETPKIYSLGKTRTNKAIKVRHGLQERIFRMEYISNQCFTDTEFQKWKAEMKLVELPLPNLQQIKDKSLEILKSRNYSLKEHDIDNIIQEKNRFRKNPLNYALKKNELLLARSVAQQTQDRCTIEKINKELEEIEDRATLLDKQRSGNLSNVNNINQRNRKKNIYDAEKAVIEEAKEKCKTTEPDPFTRRRTLPKMITKNALDDQSENVMAPSTERKIKIKEPLRNGSGNSDMFNIHDFDVEIVVPNMEATSLKAIPKSAIEKCKNATRHSLNLDEYKKRKGLM